MKVKIKLVILLFIAFVIVVGGVKAIPWWNASWIYRQQINITNNNDTLALPGGYSVSINLDTASLVASEKLRGDGNDLRVVYWDGSNNIELDRINLTDFNTSSTEIWFGLQNSIPPNSYDDNYFIYYGNPSAGEPPKNASNVFEFYDDFDDGDISDWSSFDATITAYTLSGRKTLRLLPGSLSNYKHLAIPNACNVSLENYTIEAEIYDENSAGSVFFHYANNSNWWSLELYVGGNRDIFRPYINNADQGWVYTHTPVSIQNNQWYRIKVNVFPDRYEMYIDNVLKWSQNVESQYRFSGYNKVGFVEHHGYGPLYADFIFVRKYFSPEPTLTLGNEEVRIPWWDQNYKCRTQVNITNNNLTETLEEGYSINITIDTASLYSQGRLLSNGNDLRVVYWNGTENIEIDRYNETFFDIADYDEPSDYVSRWALDEGSGSTAHDSNTTSANDGTIYGATWTGGKYGNALHFDGTNDYVEIPNSPTLNPSGAFSLSVWFKADSLSDWQGVVSKLTNVNTGNGRGFNIQIGTRENIASLMADDNGNWVYLKTSWMPETDKWYHVVLVHHSNNLNELYVNGKLEATNYHVIAFTNNPMQMGKFYTDANGLYFNGTIDEVKFYHRALTKEEIYSQYVEGKTTKIWFRLQRNIPAGGYDDNYFIYYGNPSAGEPPKNASNVFHYFDDFDTYSGWSGDVSEFSITTLEGENVLYVLPSATGYPGWIYKSIEPLTSYKIEVYMRDESDVANQPHPGVIISGTDGNNWNGVYFRARSNQIVGSTTTGGSNTFGSPLDSHDIQGATWYKVEAIVQNGVVKHLYVNGSEKINFVNWNVKDNLSIVGFFHYEGTDGPGYFDKLTVKKYIYPEPTVTLGSQVCKYPDLCISSSDITFSPSIVVETDTVTITAKVHNFGKFADANNFDVAFFLGDPNNGGTLLGTKSISVPATSSNTTSITWQAVSGSHDIFVIADYGDKIEESNESNNNASRVLNVETIKLRVVEVTPIPKNVKPGDVFKVNVTVKNLNSKTLENVKVSINLPTGWNIVYPTSGYYTVDIPSNGMVTKEFTVKIPEDVTYFVVR